MTSCFEKRTIYFLNSDIHHRYFRFEQLNVNILTKAYERRKNEKK